MSDEKRAHKRHAVNTEFESVDEFVVQYAHNLSRGGVFIRSKASLPIGTELELTLSIIEGDEFHTIKGLGVVVHTNAQNGAAGMGVEFTDLSDEDRAMVERFAGVSTDEAAVGADGE